MSKKTSKFKVGDHVYWHDPAEGVNSAAGEVVWLKGDKIGVYGDESELIVATAIELELMRQFSVDIQQTTENTYHVWARSTHEAEELALERFGNGDDGEHEGDFGVEVTNCEEI